MLFLDSILRLCFGAETGFTPEARPGPPGTRGRKGSCLVARLVAESSTDFMLFSSSGERAPDFHRPFPLKSAFGAETATLRILIFLKMSVSLD